MTAAPHLPPGPRWPLPVQALAYLASPRRFMHALGKRYGGAFTVKLPFFGPTVIISDPALVKQFFQTRTDVVRNVEPNLDLVQATIHEVQRNRPVIEGAARQVIAPTMPLGQWVIPHGYTVQVDIPLTHQNAYPDPDKFDPDRFMDSSPDLYSWVPFGGGTRRCLGAAFANMEMNVVLRTMLREFRLVPTSSPDERLHNRGVAFAPSGGGRAVVYRRMHTAESDGKVQLQAVTTVSLG
jgi:cytochrome P450